MKRFTTIGIALLALAISSTMLGFRTSATLGLEQSLPTGQTTQVWPFVIIGIMALAVILVLILNHRHNKQKLEEDSPAEHRHTHGGKHSK